MRKLSSLTIIATIALTHPINSWADVLCKIKKTGVVVVRPSSCSKKEVLVSSLSVTNYSSSSKPDITVGTSLDIQDSGAVASGADSTIGLDVNVSRLSAVGGSLTTTGMNLEVTGDAGGDSTNIGLSVNTSGADTNYCAIFQGGNVGIGVSNPDEALSLDGRLHLEQTTAPSVVTDKLYNVAGSLFWNGQTVSLGNSSSSGITSVTAGTGLSGGGTTGAIALAVDSGTSANKIVQLNSSAELPAVSGVNLSALNASNLTSGTISDSRLSSNVSLLGSSIGLSTEVAGTLPVANGGTGASSLSDLIALGTNTTGNYVASAAAGTGISVASTGGSEGSTLTLSVDQTFTPSWSALHSFQSGINVGTTTSSSEALHLNGRLHIEPSSAPSTTTDKLYNVGGSLFFNGQNLSSLAAGGDITEVNAGTGISGGATSGAVTLAVDVGTTANKIVQLNSSAQLPTVSGINLTNLNASNIASGTLSDSRLSGSVSLLGTSIDLVSEITNTLAVTHGGTGATSLNDLIALGTHTTGNYVASVAAGTGMSVGSSGAEGGTATVSLDQSVAPTWTSTHTFSGVATDITTASNENFAIVPNGTGKVGIGTTSPSAILDTVFTSTSSTAGSESGNEFNITDTGAVNSGTDNLLGLDLNVTRTGATGGTINTTALDIGLTADTGGTSTATGINVSVGGADINYAALLNGGNVGIGTTTPTALLDTVFSSTSTTAGSDNASKLTVSDSGVVSSGTDTTQGLALTLSRTGSTGGTINATGIDVGVTGDSGGAATTTVTGLKASASGADNNYAAIFSAGKVGIGTTTPPWLFSTRMDSTSTTAAVEIANSMVVSDLGVVSSGTDTVSGLNIDVTRTGATGGTISANGLVISVTGDSAGAGTSLTTGLSVNVASGDSNIAATFTGGSVGVGTANSVLTDTDITPGSIVVGNGALCVDNSDDDCASAARAAGNIYAEGGAVTGIDLAEEFPVREGDNLSAGEIVIVDTSLAERCLERGRDNNNSIVCVRSEQGLVPFVTKTRGVRAENKRVLGVVSTRPGLTLGGFGDEQLIAYKKVPIALAGRVPVKVNSENGAIEVGDRITPSSIPGQGMRADSNDLVIGIALEPLDQTSGTILVLVK